MLATIVFHMFHMYVDRTQQNLHLCPKRCWSFVKSKRKEDGLPSVMHYEESTVETAAEKCNLFAQHFKAAFSDVDVSSSQVAEALRNTPSESIDFGIFEITEDHVLEALRKLKYSASPGPDGIPSCLLKRCSAALLVPLMKLFNCSLQRGTFPAAWKTSLLSPIFKKGDKCDIANYRGITSLTEFPKFLK